MFDDPTKFTPPDWRDAGQYRHLLDLDRSGWAWEWLRRHTAYKGEGTPERGSAPVSGLDVVPASRLSGSHYWGLCFRCVTKLPCIAGAAALGRPI